MKKDVIFKIGSKGELQTMTEMHDVVVVEFYATWYVSDIS